MLDRFVCGAVERISHEAPIPVVNAQRHVDMPGGANNVARNIAALGARAFHLGVVGEDAPADDLRLQLGASSGIEADLIRDASRPTTVKTRYVAEGQQVMRADAESGAPLAEAIERSLLERFPRCMPAVDLVVLSDYAKGDLSDSVTRAAIDVARRPGKKIIVDPKSKHFGKYRGATVLTPNRQELQQACMSPCSTQEEVEAGARAIVAESVCEIMVVTRGKDGMPVIASDEAAVHLPTAARQLFDVSGASDTVVAAIAAGAAVTPAATLANLAAGIVVGKRGTATVSQGEILAVLRPSDRRTDPQKIFSLETVLPLARGCREDNLLIAFTYGCFDLLHPGHIFLLEQARRTADRLIVGSNADLSIRRLKGPEQSEVARATVLAAVKSVDAVVIFSEDTPITLIEALAPDVLIEGGDYSVATVVGADFVIARGGKVVIADLLNGHSTTETVKRVTTSATA